jgi:short-subunit dehydrogenase
VHTGLYAAATITCADKEEFYAQVPFKKMDAALAAQKILKGVDQNKGIIVFPSHARLLWWLQRLNPNSLQMANRSMMKKFRTIRREP